MCGIAGILATDPGKLQAIFPMTEIQAHRGPDGRGYVFISDDAARFVPEPCDTPVPSSAFLALGHRRLAIIDCSAAGTQPMASEDGTCWICYNGEVYNYRELRGELEALGLRFRTATDTEVVLNAYLTWGTACFPRFNGMWGLAIWDGRTKRLILARDRFGVKPLHFARLPWGVVFASEIKALFASGHVRPSLDHVAAADFLKWNLVNHEERTFFQDIHAFPPGHYAVIDPVRSDAWHATPYWQLKYESHPPQGSFEDAISSFRELFVSAVNLRMRSDVPVGSCLSGGLDSSAIVCAAAGLHNESSFSFCTFTSCFADARFSERAYAEIVNQAVGAHPHYVQPSQQAFLDDLEALIWHQEEPFTTASIYAQWQIMRSARQAGVPVLLDGQGADEILCGYRKYYLFYMKQLLSQWAWLGALREGVSLLRYGDRGMLRWREGVRYLPAFLRQQAGLDGMISSRFSEIWRARDINLGVTSDVNARQIDDLMRFSVPALLRYEDRNSMAWSIESRVPFLDYRLVEYLIGLPVEYKLKGGKTKAVMRYALRGIVPDMVLDRRDKMGFVTPQVLWMRSDLGGRMLDAFKSDFRLEGIIDQQALVRSFEGFMHADAAEQGDGFLRVFILNAWMKRFGVTC